MQGNQEDQSVNGRLGDSSVSHGCVAVNRQCMEAEDGFRWDPLAKVTESLEERDGFDVTSPDFGCFEG
jgi:hypothetical protein